MVGGYKRSINIHCPSKSLTYASSQSAVWKPEPPSLPGWGRKSATPKVKSITSTFSLLMSLKISTECCIEKKHLTVQSKISVCYESVLQTYNYVFILANSHTVAMVLHMAVGCIQVDWRLGVKPRSFLLGLKHLYQEISMPCILCICHMLWPHRAIFLFVQILIICFHCSYTKRPLCHRLPIVFHFSIHIRHCSDNSLIRNSSDHKSLVLVEYIFNVKTAQVTHIASLHKRSEGFS